MDDRLATLLELNSGVEKDAIAEIHRRFREYIGEGRNHVWHWYISNLVQPYRLTQQPVSRIVGNPPWVVYNAMSAERQDAFRQQAQDRNLWAGAHLATQNDIAATFAATCIDFYLQPGGKFGFVLPYAALRARHWAPFRAGVWSLPETSGRQPTLVDLGQDAWDLINLNSPPFPQANSSVFFGAKLNPSRRRRRAQAVPLSGVQEISNTESINPKMPWDEVGPKLIFTPQTRRATAPSPAYSSVFRNGATLFPQPLVVFEEIQERGLGRVYFRTRPGKGVWQGLQRRDRIEERFIRPALFSRLLLPFGATGHNYIIAPFARDGRSLEPGFPQGDDAMLFRDYWDKVDYDWERLSSPRPPHTLLDRIDHWRNLSAQLGAEKPERVVYNSSGSILCSAVVSSDLILSHTLYWTACETSQENHYLSAIFNARCLREFFRDACRASDRDFMLLPVQNLPIPKFDAGNDEHSRQPGRCSPQAGPRPGDCIGGGTAGRQAPNQPQRCAERPGHAAHPGRH